MHEQRAALSSIFVKLKLFEIDCHNSESSLIAESIESPVSEHAAPMIEQINPIKDRIEHIFAMTCIVFNDFISISSF